MFDNFDRIYCSVSGGKDSTVMFHLVMDEAIKRKREVGLLFNNYRHEPLVFWSSMYYWNRSMMSILKLEMMLKEPLMPPFCGNTVSNQKKSIPIKFRG